VSTAWAFFFVIVTVVGLGIARAPPFHGGKAMVTILHGGGKGRRTTSLLDKAMVQRAKPSLSCKVQILARVLYSLI